MNISDFLYKTVDFPFSFPYNYSISDTEKGSMIMAVTIKDVATLAGVSPSTVSRVCKGSPSISKETRDRVRQVMAQLGYEPGSSSPAPAQSGRKIAVVNPPSSREAYGNPFFMEAIRGISEFCNPRKIAISVITGSDIEEILQAVRNLSPMVDGFIMLYSRQEDPVVEYMCEQGILYVVVGTPFQLRDQTICVDNDNLQSSREATDYLYGLGHRKIGFLGSDSSYHFARERKAGYQLSMLQHDLPIRPEHMLEILDIVEEGTDRLKAFILQSDPPTAVVACEDILAIALTQICVQLGLSIPGDISIVSQNNSIITRLSTPALTCVDNNSFQLGYEAASQVLNHLENSNLLATRTIVPHRFVERGSCRKI